MRKIPGFLEQLFDHENFEFRFEFHDEHISVKMTAHKMLFLQKAVTKLLQDNATVLKEAYFKDLKKKFPARIIIDLKAVHVDLIMTDFHLFSKFLTKILRDSSTSYNLKNFKKETFYFHNATTNLLHDFFISHGWKKNDLNYVKEVKSAEELQIVFSQIYHILDNELDINKYIKSWKNFFKD